jgi:hypothetical protein
MLGRRVPLLFRAGSAAAVVLMLACCTPGGQFDPTEVVNSDMFSSKKKLAGDREPVFPNGVPGAETGVPPDLVKGYQPPPEQPAVSAEPATKSASAAPAATEGAATAAAAKPKAKAKAKPKSKLAKAPPPAGGHDPAWDQKPQQVGEPWPAPPGGGAAQQAQPSQQAAQPAQTNWPPPQSTAPAQQTQSGQSVWPNPPPTGTH